MARTPNKKTSQVPAQADNPAEAPAPAKGLQAVPATVEAIQLPVGKKWFSIQGQTMEFFEVVIPHSHDPEAIFNPHYWAHYTGRIGANSVLMCRDEHKRYEIWVRVLEKGAGWLRVGELFRTEMRTPTVSNAQVAKERQAFDVSFIEGIGWRVVNTRDHAVLAEGLLTKEDADSVLTKHLEKMFPKAA